MPKDMPKQQLLPKLRFPEFNNAPAWEEKRLGDLGKFTGGGTPSKGNDNFWNGDIPWVSSSDISEDSIWKININRFITEEAIQQSSTKLIPANSILLISRVGVGKIAITNKEICTSQDFTNLTPSKDNLTFLAYYLRSLKIKLLSFSQGMAIKGFTKCDVSGLNIFIPSLAEQQKIADCLSSLDGVIALEGQKLVALKDHKKGLMQNLFPSLDCSSLDCSILDCPQDGNPQEGKAIPNFRFPEFNNAPAWEEKKLGDLCKKISQGGTPDTSNVDYWKGNIEWLTPAEMSKNYTRFISSTNRKLTKAGFKNCSSDLLPINSVILSTRAPIGHVLINKTEMAINQGCKGLVVNERTNVNYLYYCIVKAKGDLNDLGSGNTFKELSSTTLKNFEIFIPSLAEQQKIADCLSSLDGLITAQAQKIISLKDHKKGLMQNLFPSLDCPKQSLSQAKLVPSPD